MLSISANRRVSTRGAASLVSSGAVEQITDIARTQQGLDKDVTVLKDLDLKETISAAVTTVRARLGLSFILPEPSFSKA